MSLLEVVTPVPATGLFSMSWLLIAIPALSAAVLLLVGRAGDRWGHLLGTLAPLVSFALGLSLFADLLAAEEAGRAVAVPLYDWISIGQWTIDAGLLVDQLSIVFVLLITGVGSLIHIYSIGYMAHDERRRRFFAFLNLFVAAMLLLVLADDYLVLFVGWEGVGLASYLLIGFWQHKPTAATAAKKAFVVNRVGDLGMSIAIMLMLATFGSSAFVTVNEGMPAVSPALATIMGLLLLLGACGKSAQVPLQSWLLDAMEGPTPVSALIHAATMVTAGVYLVTRSHAVFAESEAASTAVVIVGTVTLLVGAWIGCAKDDIKKALAGSTMSQIGYMMLAAGIGPAGYAFAIFHLLTHGFFKANLFLGAGSVMHGMDDDVNMRHYGGLARAMPITFVTFAAGYLAIIGFPFFSGYYSKDHIIEAAFERSAVIGLLALLGAGVTAFYMTRVMLLTFFGKQRWQPGVHPHESPLVMTVPLLLLGAASVVGGLLLNNWISGWLDPAVGGEHGEATGLLHFSLIGGLTLAVVAIGVTISVVLFGPRRDIPRTAPESQLALGPGRPERRVRRRVQRGGVHAARAAADRRTGPAGGLRHRRHGERHGDRDRRPVRPAAPVPERVRPLVRADDDRGRRGHRRGARARTAGLRGFDMDFPVLTLLALLPAVGAVAVVLAGARLAKQVALVAAVATAVVAGVVALRFTPGGGQQFAEQVTWIRPLGAYYALGLDGIGLTLVLLVVIVTPVVIVASWRDFDKIVPDQLAAQVRLAGVLRPGAGGGDLCALPVPGHRRLPVLRVLRGHPDPDVLPDRRLRARAAPDVRGGQVLDLRAARRVRDAGLGDRAVRAVGRGGGGQLPAQHPERAGVSAPGPSAGCSSASCSPSPSRRRWCRCTPGCPMRPRSPAPAAPR